MQFKLQESLRGAPDEELLKDLRRSAHELGRDTITMDEYCAIGIAHPSTHQRRFGSWSRALELAGLQPSRSKIGISKGELFENLKSLWLTLGRQPKYSDVKLPNSKYSVGTYENRFGSWMSALADFIEWVSVDAEESPTTAAEEDERPAGAIEKLVPMRPRTRREISDRQRFRILVRDGFQCQSCGTSPLKERGVELHVDHIIPWSKGGETIDGNLETKCATCNLGKGNAFTV